MLVHKVDDEVSLRLFNIDDAEEFHNLIINSKFYLKEWLGWLDYTKSVEDTAQYIISRCNEHVEYGGYPQSFAIISNGEIAGTIGFNEIHKSNKIGVVGYWLGEKYQGKGIMSKALKALINYGFNDLKLNRIEIRVAVENKKSKALPERFGFKEEGTLRQVEWLYDHYVDHVIYGLLANDWK